jgi:hypothetical protein
MRRHRFEYAKAMDVRGRQRPQCAGLGPSNRLIRKVARYFSARDGCSASCHYMSGKTFFQTPANRARKFSESRGKRQSKRAARSGGDIQPGRHEHGGNRTRCAHAISLDREIHKSRRSILPVDPPIEDRYHIRCSRSAEKMIGSELGNRVRDLRRGACR